MKKLKGIYFSKETLKRLMIYAATNGMTDSDVVEQAVWEYLNRKDAGAYDLS